MPEPFRILVAEDDESALVLITVLLEQDGRFAVVGRAANGVEAVNLAKRLTLDAVVVDIEMPVLDGVEATRQIHDRWPDLPIVAISGHDYVRKTRVATELPRVLAAVLGTRPNAS